MPKQPWYVNWLAQITHGNQTNKRLSAQLFLMANKEERQLASQSHQELIRNFISASPCESDFPSIAALEVLRENGTLDIPDFFLWMRLHASCVSLNITELLLALWHVLKHKDYNLAAIFAKYLRTKAALFPNINKYNLKSIDVALQFMCDGKRDIEPDVEPTIHLHWREASKVLNAINLHQELPYDKLLELIEIVPAKIQSRFAHEKIKDLSDILQTDYSVPLSYAGDLKMHANLKAAQEFAEDCHRTIASDIVYALYQNVAHLDRMQLADQAIVPRLVDILEHRSRATTGEVSNLVPYAAYYLRHSAKGQQKIQTEMLQVALLGYFFKYEAQHHFSILEGWVDAFALFSLNASVTKVIADAAKHSIGNHPVHPGAMRTLFYAWQTDPNVVKDVEMQLNLSDTIQEDVLKMIGYAYDLYNSTSDLVPHAAATCYAPTALHERQQLSDIAQQTEPQQFEIILAAMFAMSVMIGVSLACCDRKSIRDYSKKSVELLFNNRGSVASAESIASKVKKDPCRSPRSGTLSP